MGESDGLGLSLRAALIVLAALLAGDALIVALYLDYVRTAQGAPTPLALHNPTFLLSLDGGLAERLEYLKSMLTAAVLFRLASHGGGRLFLALAGVHAWFLADNLLKLHERAGRLLGQLLAPDGALTLASRDFGEFMAFGAIGAGLALQLWLCWRKADAGQRRAGGLLIFTAGSLVLFATVADALHASRLGPLLGETFWVLLEDGGETLVLSLNCALAAGFAVAAGVRFWPAPAAATPHGAAEASRGKMTRQTRLGRTAFLR